MFLPDSYVEVLIPSIPECEVFEDMVFTAVTKFKIKLLKWTLG